MKIVKYPSELASLPPLGIALGFFDGVHRGHRELIARTVRAARERGLAPAIFTFPAESEGLKSGSARLYDTEQKLELLKRLDIEYVILADFSAILSLTPEQFVGQVLVRELNCRLSASGRGFRFGKGAAGDSAMLERLMKEAGGESITVDELLSDGKPLSTTRIRAALSQGDCAKANEMLGFPYRTVAVVEHGLGLGRSFGFPTLNTALPEDSPLKRGVYATRVKIGENLYTGVTNVGVCPTVGTREKHCETLLVSFDGSVYGERITVYFLEYLRDERSFPSIEELKKQIDIDKHTAIRMGEKYNGRKLD